MLNQLDAFSKQIPVNKTHPSLTKGQLHTALRHSIAGVVVLAAVFGTSEAFACASCGCTLSTDWGSQGVSTKAGFSADLSFSYINQNQLIYGNSKPSSEFVQSLYANQQEIETSTITQTTTASLNYNGDTGGVSLQIPYLNRTHGTNGQTDTTVTPAGSDYGTGYSESANSGLGDIRLIGHYNGFSEDKTTGIIFGIKFATGDYGANFSSGAASGQPLDAGLQLGTASTDYILGAYTSGTVSTYGWFVQGTVQHSLTGLVQEASGSYRPGDAYLLNSGIRYAGFGATVSPMLQLNLIHREIDQGSAVPTDVFTGDPVSGGNLAYLSPGVSIRVGGGTSVYGFVQVPIYQNVGSLQLVPSYIANIGIHQNF